MTPYLRLAPAALLALSLVGVGPGCGSDQAAGPAPPSGSAGSGQGGTPGTGGAGGGATHPAIACPDGGGPVDPTALIDDMEAGGPSLLMEAGRNGTWWAGGDAVSPGASIDPNGEASSELIPNGGRCGSLHAKHVTGQGFTNWAVLTATLRVGQVDGGAYIPFPYDAHIRTGVTFWARIGSTSAAQVRFAVSDKYTRPEGGICDPNAATGSTACYDTAGVDLTQLGTTWTQYRIPFAGLGQRNFGLPEPQMGPDTSALYTIDFNFYPNEIFDFWIDDISFY
ncbi:MAG TPA: hypothetical protein VKZ18_22410 [Polyangia bacterium]|nr:hypothetical protein [Polyangia bacterium]